MPVLPPNQQRQSTEGQKNANQHTAKPVRSHKKNYLKPKGF